MHQRHGAGGWIELQPHHGYGERGGQRQLSAGESGRVSGGASASANTSDSTTINSNSPVLGIAKSHNGNFTQGQQNATYTITVSNTNGAGTTNGTVTGH